ncbi:MAG TPA: ParA family protein [Gemmatimonadaceae bacterium]|nr:ParA family protein [Gemmatimonadaceae bacterium]
MPLQIESTLRDPVVIAIANQKGGVGKTMISVNLAHALLRYLEKRSRRGGAASPRVLLIDGDPQASLTAWLQPYDASVGAWVGETGGLFDNSEEFSIAEPQPAMAEVIEARPRTESEHAHVLERSVIPVDAERLPGLYLLPTSLAAQVRELELIQRHAAGGEGPALHIRDRLLPLLSQFDAIVIDSAPGISSFTKAAYLLAQWAIIPTGPNTLAFEGVVRTRNSMLEFRRACGQLTPPIAPPIEIAFVLRNMFFVRSSYGDAVTMLLEGACGDRLWPQQITYRAGLSEISSPREPYRRGLTVFEAGKDLRPISEQFDTLAQTLLKSRP